MFKTISMIFLMSLSLNSMAGSLITVPPELQGKKITIVVPYSPGGDADSAARPLAEQLEKITGLEFIVSNRPGAQATIGANHVAKSAPDGSTLLLTANDALIMNPLTKFTNAPDPKSLAPIGVLYVFPQVLFTGYDSNIRTVADAIREAKNNPKFVLGANTPQQALLNRSFFKHTTGKDPYLVMFKNAAEAAISAHQGSVSVFSTATNQALPLVQSKKIRPIGVGVDHPQSNFPNIEYLSKYYPGFESTNFLIVILPAGTPVHIQEFYNRIIRLANNGDILSNRWQTRGYMPKDFNLTQTTQFVDKEYRRASKVYNQFNQ